MGQGEAGPDRGGPAGSVEGYWWGAVGPYSGVTRVPLALCVGWRGDWGLEAGQDPRGTELGSEQGRGRCRGRGQRGAQGRESNGCSHS